MSDLSQLRELEAAAVASEAACPLSREELLILHAMENGGSIWKAWKIGIAERDA